nr:ATP-dependent DNA helicase PIF1-like [Tanacetum cinerariifolium]
MLLNVVRGAQSFTDLKMVNKINYATFKAACFAYPKLNLTDGQVRNYCLLEIQDILNTHGKSLTDFKDHPQPNPNLLTNLDNRLLREALSFDANKSKVEHGKLHSMLNPKQRLIYEHIIESMHNDKGQFYFIHGPGGTGKTFLYKTIIARLRLEQMIVLAVASSSIASLLLPAARTTHSRFVIPLELMENSTCALDKTLQDILGYKNQARRNRIFGGMTVLLGGDFWQILAVIPNAKRPE